MNNEKKAHIMAQIALEDYATGDAVALFDDELLEALDITAKELESLIVEFETHFARIDVLLVLEAHIKKFL